MRTIVALFASVFIIVQAVAQVKPVDNGVAIGGYDVVSYFTTAKAVKGNPQFQVLLGDVYYYFSSKENQELFEAEPAKYLPQYDGYCALAVSYGKKISINPQTFKIINDKLYLFYHTTSGKREVNSLDTWVKNEPKLLKRADELWPDVKKKKFVEGEKL